MKTNTVNWMVLRSNTLALAAVWTCGGLSTQATAQVVSLGAAGGFAVLAGSTVTSTGSTNIFGDVGVSPGTAVTGLLPANLNGGVLHLNDALAIQAQIDASAAFDLLEGLTATQDLTVPGLGAGSTLTQGVYNFDSSALLSGVLTLDGQNLANPLFVFQIGTALTTASNFSIAFVNGSNSDDVFFQVGSSATLGTGTTFNATIIADQSITANTGASVNGGRLLALNAAVTLDSNVIVVPEPASAFLLATSLGLMSFRRRRRG